MTSPNVLTLEGLQQQSLIASQICPLAQIACISKSTSNAYNLAKRLDWDKEQCDSVKALSEIYFRYGQEVFRETIISASPAFTGRLCFNPSHHLKVPDCDCGKYGEECLCNCHYCPGCDQAETYCGGYCDCNCHISDDYCDACDSHHEDDEDDDESSCSCSCHVCDDCDDDDDCDEDCDCSCHDDEPCERSSIFHEQWGAPDWEEQSARRKDPIASDPKSQPVPTPGPSSGHAGLPPVDEKEPSPEVKETAQARVERVVSRLQESGGEFDGTVKVVRQIEGDTIQGIAYEQRNEIQVTEKLVELMKTDDQLAWLLGHEMAHHEHQDHTRMSEHLTQEQAVLHAGSVALDHELKEKGWSAPARIVTQIGVGLVAVGVSILNDKAKSREHEEEADQRAVELMSKAGFDPGAAPEAYSNLHQGRVSSQGFVGSLLSTHPDPPKRLATLEKEAGNQDSSD